jgi:hypothetical protein
LGASIQKRCGSIHIVVVPRLMTSRWRKKLGKVRGLILNIPLGFKVWSQTEHEPLPCAIYLLLSAKKPWRYQDSPKLDDVERSVSEVLPIDSEGRTILHYGLLPLSARGDVDDVPGLRNLSSAIAIAVWELERGVFAKRTVREATRIVNRLLK